MAAPMPGTIANALMQPSAARSAPPPGPMMPGVQPPVLASRPVPEVERISPRVPVPKADFPEKHHKDLHDKVMGEAFDNPLAAHAVRDIYSILRQSRPHLHPRYVLEAARDAWHAVQHGFMPVGMVGSAVGPMAEMRHQQADGKHPADEEKTDE